MLKKIKSRLILIATSFMLFVFAFQSKIFAISPSEEMNTPALDSDGNLHSTSGGKIDAEPILNPLKVPDNVADFLSSPSVFEGAWHDTQFLVIKGLYSLLGMIEDAVNSITHFNPLSMFFESVNLTPIYSTVIVLLLISIFVFALRLSATGEREIFQSGMKGILSSILVIVLAAGVTEQVNNIYNLGIGGVTGKNGIKIGTDYIKGNVFNIEKSVEKKRLVSLAETYENPLYVNGDEKVRNTGENAFKYNYNDVRIVLGKNGKPVDPEKKEYYATDLKAPVSILGAEIPFTGEGIYEYNFFFGRILINSLIVAFFAIVLSYKFIRNGWDMIQNFILLLGFGGSDLSRNGERRKNVIIAQCNLFFVNIWILFSFQLWNVMYSIFNAYNDAHHLPLLAYLIVLFGLAMTIVDGSERLPQLLGLDAGVKSGMNILRAGFFAGNMAKGALRTGTNALSHIPGMSGLRSGLSQGNANSGINKTMQGIGEKLATPFSSMKSNARASSQAYDMQRKNRNGDKMARPTSDLTTSHSMMPNSQMPTYNNSSFTPYTQTSTLLDQAKAKRTSRRGNM